MAVVVLDEQHLGVGGEHLAQLPGARLGDGRAGRVLGPAGEHHGARAFRQRPPDLPGQRPLVVDGDRQRPQPERRDEVEEAPPARVLDREGVTGPQVSGEDTLDGVEGAGGRGERARGDAVGREGGAREPGELGVQRLLSVEDRPGVGGSGGLGEGGREGGQQPRVGVAGRQVASTGRHLDPDLVARRGDRPGPDAAAAPPGRLDHPALPQQAVGGRDGVRVDPQPVGQLPQRRQGVARRERAGGDAPFHAGGNLCGTPPGDPILS
ncbi:hypothetical protein EES44_12835 [Streptomyces sp. ADI96-15]|nr:hypothetical protein EES44_12835 [Streptomyces sp. ADI96-15]